MITHIPGGLLAEKYGARHVMGLSIFFTAVLTVLTPGVTEWGDATALIVLQFLIGLCGGVIHPAVSNLLSRIAPEERSFIGSLVYYGCWCGLMVSTSLSGFIMGRFDNDWPLVFHLFGAAGIAWFFIWMMIFSDGPRNYNRFISVGEKEYLRELVGRKKQPFPWRHALTSKPFLALVMAHAGSDYCSYTIMSDLPKYMNNVLKLPVELTGYASSIHLVSSRVYSIAVSWLSDKLVQRKCASITSVRKYNTAISSIGPGVMLIAAMYVGCNVIQAVALITIGLTLTGSRIPGALVNVIDLSPTYAGTLMGIMNGIGALCGILAPYTVGILAPDQTLGEWKLIFWIIFAVFTITALNFVVYGSGDVQPWDNAEFLKRESKRREGARESTRLLDLERYRIPLDDIFYGVNKETFLR